MSLERREGTSSATVIDHLVRYWATRQARSRTSRSSCRSIEDVRGIPRAPLPAGTAAIQTSAPGGA